MPIFSGSLMSGRPLQHRPGREKECLSLSLEPSCQKRIVVLRVALALYCRQGAIGKRTYGKVRRLLKIRIMCEGLT